MTIHSAFTNKKNSLKTGGLALFTLLVTLFSLTTLSQAHAADTIYKDVTAVNQSNNPQSGVKFALWLNFVDPTKSRMSEIVTTGADGKARITIPKDNYTSIDLMMQPPTNVGSVRTFINRFNTTSDQGDISAYLVKPSSTVLSIKNPDNSVAAPGTILNYRFGTSENDDYITQRIIDPSEFALGIGGNARVASAAWITGQTYGIEVAPAAGFACNSLAPRDYGFTFDGSNPRGVTFKNSDATAVTSANNVTTLTLGQPKVSGKLVNNDGSAFVLAGGTSGYVTFTEVNESGTAVQNSNYYAGAGCINSDGTWAMTPRADGSAHYIKAAFSIGGSLSAPSFLSDLIIRIAPSGNFENTYGIGAGSTSASLAIPEIRMPLPNLGFTFSVRDSQAIPTGYLNVSLLIGDVEYPYISSDVNNQYVSGRLPAGQYRLDFSPSNLAFARSSMFVTINDAGVVVRKNISDVSPLTPTTPGFYSVVLENALVVKVRPVTASGATINPTQIGNVNIFSTVAGGFWADMGTDGLLTSYLAPGEYQYTVYPNWSNNPAGLLVTTYLLNIASDGTPTFKTEDGQTSIPIGQDGVFNLAIKGANFLFQVTKPDGSAIATVGAANVTWEKGEQSEGLSVDGSGLGAGLLSPGNYTLNVSGGGAARTYALTVSSSGVVSFTNPAITADPTTGRFKISASPANFTFKVLDPTDSSKIVLYSYAFLENTEFENLRTDSTGYGYANVSAGSYTFTVGGNDLIHTRKSYRFTVSAQGVVTWTGTAPTQDLSGAYLVSPLVSNFFYKVVNPDTNEYVASKESGAQIRITVSNEWRVGFTNYQTGTGSLAIPVGSYDLTVDPNGSLFADRIYSITVAQDGSITFTGTAPSKDLNGNYILMPSKANFVANMLNPATEAALINSWYELCNLDGAGNTTSCRGYGTNSNGDISTNFTDGKYQIRVNPNASLGLAMKKYEVTVSGNGQTIVVSGISKDQTTGKWKLYASTPNLAGSFIDATISNSPITIDSGKAISTNLQRKSGENWIWENSGFWATTNSWVYNLSHNPSDGQGNTVYRIVATPQGISDLSMSYSALIYVNPSNQVSLTADGTFVASLSGIQIVMRAPNVKLFISNPKIPGTGLNYGWVEMQKREANGGQTWAGNLDLNPNSVGKVGASLTEGTYTFTVNPPRNELAIAGLASAVYTVTVDANLVVSISTKAGVVITAVEGVFTLSPATANITPEVKTSQNTLAVSTNQNQIWAQVQVWNVQNNYWDWTSLNAVTDSQGKLSMSVTDPGKYRLRIEPNGLAGATLTYSKEFTVDAQGTLVLPEGFSPIILNSPSITIRITSDGVTGLANTSFEIRKNGQTIDWGNTNSTTLTGGLALPDAGTYDLIINPPWDGSAVGFAKKSYTITAVKSGDVVTATVNGVTPVNGVSILTLGTASLKGQVRSPSNQPVRDSQVIATDVASGREMWEYSVNTSTTGSFAMSLPAGTYTLQARAPYGSTTVGNSSALGRFTLDANGAVTANTSGADATNVTLTLKSPTWLGTLKSPDGSTVIANAQVCFVAGQGFSWSCSNTNTNGQWALTAPDGFSAFDENSLLEVRENINIRFSPRRYQGTAAMDAILGTTPCVLANSTPSCSIEIKLLSPNTQITVTAGGQPVANAWVNIDRDGSGWLGGSSTDSSGVARLSIVNPESAFNVRVEINGTSVANVYTSTTVAVPAESAGANYIRSKTVSLSQPNIRGVVTEPVAGGGSAVVPFTWVELFNESDNRWLGGTSTDINGAFSLNAPGSSSGSTLYLINVNPSQNSTSVNSKQVYSVVIPDTDDASSAPVITLKSSGALITPTTTGNPVWTLSLAAPSVTGIVKGSNGSALMNSWIVPIDKATGENYWQLGVNSRSNGVFSLALVDGTYLLEANTPWGNSTDARSARCEVTILAGAITTPVGGCVQTGANGKTVTLSLRAPNLTFTLVDGSNNPVANAGVGIGFGSWNTYSQSSSTGKVSLFVDNQAIADANAVYGIDGQRLRLWVDPPWGNTNIVRWDCNAGDAPRCSAIPDITAATITTAYPVTNAATIAFATPNTKLVVKLPGGTTAAGQGAWISIFNIDINGNRQWIAGGNTDTSGTAAFNIESAFNKLAVEVNAPYDKRNLYSSKIYDNNGAGYTQSEVNNASFELASPNVSFTIKASDSTANKWGWIGIERCLDGIACTSTTWVSGYGLDDKGRSSAILSSEGGVTTYFRVTAYPGGGRAGSRTVCSISVTAADKASATCSGTAGEVTSAPNADVLNLIVTLSNGNVSGLVKAPDNSAVVGAVVYANLVVDGVMSTDSATAVTTSTNATGGFGLQLDSSKQWRIKILPVDRADLAIYLSTTNISFSGDLANLETIKLELAR